MEVGNHRWYTAGHYRLCARPQVFSLAGFARGGRHTGGTSGRQNRRSHAAYACFERLSDGCSLELSSTGEKPSCPIAMPLAEQINVVLR